MPWFLLGAVASIAASLWFMPAPSDATGTPERITVELTPSTVVANGTSTSAATAIITKGAARVSGHAVVFSSSEKGIHVSATTDKPDGVYTATLTSGTVAGTATITATDKSVSPPPSGKAILTQVPGPAKKITHGVDPGSIAADGASYTTATATVTDAHGNPVSTNTVEFSSSDPGEKVLQVANNGNGTYSALIRSSTNPGPVTIAATDTSADLRAQAELIQTVNSTSLSLVAFPSTVVTNEGVTLLAVATSAGSPSGAITFTNRGAPIPSCVAVPITPWRPAAVCQTSFAALTSPEQLAAAFAPDAASNVTSSSAMTTVTVTPDSTSTSLDVSKTVAVRASTTYTATVTAPPNRPGSIEPSGSVQFLDGGQAIDSCRDQPLTDGAATCTVAYDAVSAHSMRARYSGDVNFTGSTSPSETVGVVPLQPEVLGIVSSTLQWSFYYTHAYTQIVAMVINGAPAGATVLVTCHGRGCPFAKHVAAIAHSTRCVQKRKRGCASDGALDLASRFGHRRLKAGTRITVEITRPSWIGKYYLFATRAGRGPRIRIACLAPGGTRPGVRC